MQATAFNFPHRHQVYCSRTIGCRRVGLIHRLRARLNARAQRRAYRAYIVEGRS
ncbi:hypothetical protein [Algiphilus sp.]|uniref:hypothetical protein n=1 Tax=Algiphilus sp. TaxID=1872431 RepID=UPI003CCBDE79